MKLYESVLPSGNAYKVVLLLGHLGRTYDVERLDIMAQPSETRRPEFLAKNPNGRIPVLELDDGTYLPESGAILFYLAEGTPYLPAERLQRAQVLQWMFFEQYSHEPYIAVLKFWTYWGGLENLAPVLRERCEVRGQEALDVMGTHLAQRKFMVADRYTIADIALFAYTQHAAQVGFRVPRAVSDWLERVREQPGHVAMRPDPQGKCP